MRDYLTPYEKGLILKMKAGWTLTAKRIFPHDWAWTLSGPSFDDRHIADGYINTMALLGCIAVRPDVRQGDYETQRAVPVPAVCNAIWRKAPPQKVDPDQVDWVEDLAK